jgi:O-antigen ligase
MQQNKPGKIYFYLLMLLAFVVPSGFGHLANGLLAPIFIFAIINGNFKKYSYRLKDPRVWLPALIYLLTLAGFFISDNRGKALSYLSAYLPYLAPALLIAGPSLTLAQRNNILKAFILSLTASLLACDLFGVIDIIRTNEKLILLDPGTRYFKLSSYGLTRFFGDWHPTFAGTFAVWAIAFIITARLYRPSISLFKPVIEISLLIFLLGNIILLNSIAAILALCTLTIMWISYYLIRRKVRPVFVTIFLLLLVSAVFTFFYANPLKNEKIKTLKERGFKITDKEEERNFLTIRMAKWVSHIEVFKKHPVLGVTPADISAERKAVYAEKGFDYLLSENLNAHNQYLEMLCRFGITGLVIFLLFLFVPLWYNYSPLYLSFVIAGCIVFLTESFLERQQGLLAFMVLYGLINMPLAEKNEEK